MGFTQTDKKGEFREKTDPFFLLDGFVGPFVFPTRFRSKSLRPAKEISPLHPKGDIDSFTDKVSQKFAEAVERKTGGLVEVTIHPRNQLRGSRGFFEKI